MDSELAGFLAKSLEDNLDCAIETRVATSGSISLVVQSGKATCLVRRVGERLVISPMLLQLGKYVKDGDGYPMSVECAISENALIAALVPFVEQLELYVDSLRMRQKKVKGDYESRQEIAKAICDANPKMKSDNYGTDIFAKGKTWQVSAEVVDGNRVSMYIDCAPDIAVAVIKAIAESGKHG